MRGAQEFLVHPYLLWDGSIRMRFYNTVLINMGQPSTPTVQVQATVVLCICVRVLYHSASTARCGFHLVLPKARSTTHCQLQQLLSK